jgi:uncharacterized membrane protein
MLRSNMEVRVIREEPQPAVDVSQDKPKKPIQTREYTSSIIGWILRCGVILPQAIIASGLLLLIVTPVVSVITSVVAFAIERDRRFVVIALVVLAILITSMLIGKGGG